jgi:hypothetical protein
MDPTVRISVLIGILRSPGAYDPVSPHKVLLIFYWNPTDSVACLLFFYWNHMVPATC